LLPSIEPAIQPVLNWQNVDREMFFWFTEEHWHERFGSPVSESHWEANNAASIAHANADSIRQSGLKIYLECGDQDYLDLHKGAEFLHRIMWDNSIQHEYRSYHGADHLGASIEPRIQEGLRFLGQVIRGTQPDPALETWRKEVDYWRRHGHPPPKD
jgi:S-formylglutathione hydrolase